MNSIVAVRKKTLCAFPVYAMDTYKIIFPDICSTEATPTTYLSIRTEMLTLIKMEFLTPMIRTAMLTPIKMEFQHHQYLM